MKKVLITAGPTYEPIDPVRFIGNRSSGKQGAAIAKAFADEGYSVNLVVGPVESALLENLNENIKIYRVNTAQEMLEQCLANIDCDIAIHSAAVSDYCPRNVMKEKIKKNSGFSLNDVEFVENADILATFCKSDTRPNIVVGFAAETTNLIENAKSKLEKKGCDFIMANDVSNNQVFGQDKNKIYLIGKHFVEEWSEMSKYEVGLKLAKFIASIS